ncbi:MAG: AzlC family ABC transporter permease [Candidatus Izemoplasmatales bacterium]|nr:AzlC family ABC transporter permease [Candidatus Izemoplasmatales bacterium]
MNQTFKKAFIHTIPVMIAFLFLGIGYGMVMEHNGYNFIWSFFISLFTFAGSAQFAMVSFLSLQIHPIYVFFIIFIINARHIFYGISMNEKYSKCLNSKWYLYFGLTDETFTVLNSHDLSNILNKKKYYLTVTLLHHIYWVTGSVLGGILGSILPFEIVGLDFILTALFVSVLVSQMKKSKVKIPGWVGFFISLGMVLIFKDQFIVPAMVLIVLFLILYEKKYVSKAKIL